MELRMSKHDIVIIGGGPGGYVAAIKAAQLGLDSAVVEMEDRLGGTCLRVGCIPSKALLESSERYHAACTEAAAHGININDIELDLATMMFRKDKIVNELTKGIDMLFKKNNVTRYLGRGRIAGQGRVTIEGKDNCELAADHIIIATGSIPTSLPGVELDGEFIGTSTMGLSMDKVPEHLVVIGAGVIGLELGSVWNRLGSKVTVLEYMDTILPGLDSEIIKEATRIFKKQKLTFHLGARVTGAKTVNDEDGKRCLVEAEGLEPIVCDRVLLVVGRKPYTDGLGLESVGVELDKHGRITVDGEYRTSAPGVYAVGDVIPGPMLAHKAEEEGIACVELIAGVGGHVNYNAIPAVVYTWPEIASVGPTEDELISAGVEYHKGSFMFRANGRAKAIGTIDGRVKILADAASGKVLGVHIIGPHAGDLIAECVMAIELGATSENIARTSHAHPSLSEAVKEAAMAVDGKSIHG
jgi:dihydrolipoamide dehydrogenase